MNGGCLRGRRFGWVKPPGAKSDTDMSKDPAAEAVYVEWFRMLDEDAATFGEVARWLRSQGVTFPSLYRDQWGEPDGQSVAQQVESTTGGMAVHGQVRGIEVREAGIFVHGTAPVFPV